MLVADVTLSHLLLVKYKHMTSVYILYVTVRETLQRQSSVHTEPFYIVIIFYSFCSEQRPRDVAVVGKITANQWWFLGSGKMETLSLDSTGRPPLSLPLSFSLQSATDDDTIVPSKCRPWIDFTSQETEKAHFIQK